MRLSSIILLIVLNILSNQKLYAIDNSPISAENAQLLDFDATNYDAGTLYVGDESYPYFSFVNRSHQNVKIKSVKPKGSYSYDPYRIVQIDTNKIIKPGQRDTLFFKRYHSVYFNKPGNYDLSWTVSFVDSKVEQQLNIFCVLVENRGEIILESENLPTVNIGETISFSSQVQNTGKDTVTLRIPEHTYFTNYLGNYPVKIAPFSEQTMHFEVNTETFSNRYRKNVMLSSNSHKKNRVRIPIYGEIIATNRPDIYFDTLTLRLDIMEGERAEYRFKYTNTGDMPLIISMCKSSCGCVVASCSRAPLPPGASDEVLVRYDSKRVGPINKTVTVTSNGVMPSIVLRIRGHVSRQLRTEEIPFGIKANRSRIKFETKEQFSNYAFNEERKAIFYFRNEGQDSLFIERTTSADGIEVTHPKNPIPPGKTGQITAVYDTKRVGQFNRHITVISSGTPYTTTLELKGLVKAKNDTTYIGPTFLFERVEIDTVFEYGADARFEFPFMNSGNEPLIISQGKSSVPITSFPKVPILPGEVGMIKVKYDAKRVGNFHFPITLYHNGTTQRTVLKIRGKVNPKPSELETAILKGPRISFDSTTIIRNYEYDEKIQDEITFTNTGDEPLIIQMSTSSGGLVTTFSTRPIMPGEKGIIYAKYNTLREGPFSKSIWITHNAGEGRTMLHFNGSVSNKHQIISYLNPVKSAIHINFNTVFIEQNFEMNEAVEIEYRFTNNGDSTFTILRVNAMDGGIATFSKTPIKRSQQSIIKCIYPKNNLGPFNRTIVVYHDANDEPIILKFKGVIF